MPPIKLGFLLIVCGIRPESCRARPSPEFADFMGKHGQWLKPYAAFCFLRDVFGTSEHWKWGILAHPQPSDIARLTSPKAEHHDIIRFTYYIQFHLHCQLFSASQYAAQNR
eukprot:scaffold196544_cov19-Prasinocladus_malaysianus.AAC.1